MQYKIFGCKVNKYYADKWFNSGFFSGKKGIFVLSCVVTDKAKKKWVKFVIDTIKKLEKDEKVYLSGCGSIDKGKTLETFFELYKELAPYKDKIEILPEEPDLVNCEKGIVNNILSYGENANSKNENDRHPELVSGSLKGQDNSIDSGSSPEGHISKSEGHKSIYTKKFILIQSGCDSFCSFCLTVKKRGRHYFREKEVIIKDILDYEKQGGKEVVLTGINLGAWGLKSTNDLSGSKLSELVEAILNETKIQRIRISSLGPEFVDEKLLKLFENKRIYPHIHYSLQSGSDKILKSMNRHYDAKNLKDILQKTRDLKREDNVDISIGADLIVGFPGETEMDFLDTYNLVKDYGITKLHAFTFSPHKYAEDVPAGKFENQIDEKTKKERYDRLITLGDKIRNDFIKSQTGKIFEVLIESVKNGQFKGWTQNYIEVTNQNFEITSGILKKNEIVIGKLR
ncbi:MAG: radical SAM protein [Candidatus Gracilibacteria bacterium]|nr:radical SAM protein [Candidatus Gracilibacteria bacterium]